MFEPKISFEMAASETTRRGLNATFRFGCVGLAVAAFALTGCSDDTASDSTTTVATSSSADCNDPAKLPLTTPGKLTVATGEPAFEPWAQDDDPSNGKGFEPALVYDVAQQLGLEKADVVWVRTGFDEAIAPGDKDYDFNVQQYSITKDRDEVVDFSRGYYNVEQALVAAKNSPIVSAKSVADLKGAKLGAAIGTTSLDYAEKVIKPTTPVAVYDDNAAAKAAFDAGQVDGLVFDLPTAFYITAVEIPDASIVGVLPAADDAEKLGFLFADGSKLVSCVNTALDSLDKDGTLSDLTSTYLKAGGDIPTLKN